MAKIAHLILLGCFMLTTTTARAQESTACDMRTDAYNPIFRVGTKADGLTLCLETEVRFDDDGPYSEIIRLFAIRTVRGKEQILKVMTPTSRDSAFGLWVGPSEFIGGQYMRTLQIWFSSGASTYVATSCEGGRLCNDAHVGAVHIQAGRKIWESDCFADDEDSEAWCRAMDLDRLFDGQYMAGKYKPKYPRMFQAKRLPSAIERILSQSVVASQVVSEPYDAIGATEAVERLIDVVIGNRALSTTAVRSLSQAERRVLRNAIYARHGRPFKDPVLDAYFRSKSWCRVRSSFTEAQLTATDQANIRLLPP